MHIYLVRFPKWSYTQADMALQLVHPKVGGKRKKTPMEMIKRLRKYKEYLRQLDNMLRNMPSVKKRGET